VISKVFEAAGRTEVKAGTQFLRHNAASRLLRAAVPLPTISAVLGHADPESTNQYISVDDDRLLQCVLGVPEAALEGGRS
jgi:site-specific recombinase XerD